MELVYDNGNLALYNFVLRKGKEALIRMSSTPKEYRERVKNTTSGHLKKGVE